MPLVVLVEREAIDSQVAMTVVPFVHIIAVDRNAGCEVATLGRGSLCGAVHVVRVISNGTHQLQAAIEHAGGIGISAFLDVPRLVAVDGGQALTVVEHAGGRRHLTYVEAVDIEGLQLNARVEHEAHVYHLAGVQILQPLKLYQMVEVVEPASARLGLELLESLLEHHCCNIILHLRSQLLPSQRLAVVVIVVCRHSKGCGDSRALITAT